MPRNKKSVLVTGAGGFIGSHLVEALCGQGYRVKAFVRYNSRNHWGWLEDLRQPKGLSVISGDIRNYDTVIRAMEGVEIVFHLAALIGIPYSYSSPDSYVDTNIKGTLNILQAARESGVARLVHTSTSEVYGSAQSIPISETHPINPQSPYAATKAAADFLALSFYRSFDLPVVIVRPFNNYGPRQSLRAVIPTIIAQIAGGSRSLSLGNTAPTRDLLYVKDSIQGFIAAARSGRAAGRVINLGTNSEIAIGDLAHLIAKIMGVKIKIKRDQQRVRKESSEVQRLRADTREAKELLGWQARYRLEDGLRETISWLRRNAVNRKSDLYHI